MVASMQTSKKKGRFQAAALPHRVHDGQLSILLVTSRETRRWVIPKGWVDKGERPARAARREAFEEAGLTGKVSKSAMGAYSYGKRLPDGSTLTCVVKVYPLKVESQKRKWPERGLRDGRWFTPEDAAAAVDEPELRDLITRFAASQAPAPAREPVDDLSCVSAV